MVGSKQLLAQHACCSICLHSTCRRHLTMLQHTGVQFTDSLGAAAGKHVNTTSILSMQERPFALQKPQEPILPPGKSPATAGDRYQHEG